MKNLHSLSALFIVIVSTFVFTACTTPSQNQQKSGSSTQSAASELEQKSGFTTLSGTLRQQANGYLLETTTGPVTLKSFDVDLSSAVGTSITVSGKYSGDELFVSEILQ